MNKSKETPEKFEFQFLTEIPVSNSDSNKLSFGHPEIISTLAEIVLTTNTPFTIGLFGKWGSGKSSIAESLQTVLKKDKIPVIIFDVWKHEGDSLRRTFLKNLVGQLQSEKYGGKFFNKQFKLNERVTAPIVKSEDVYRFHVGKLGYHLLIVLLFSLLILTPAAALYVIFQYILRIDITAGFNIGSFITALSSIASVGFIFKYLDQFIKTVKVEVRQDRFQDPYEFESAFRDVLKELKNRRILIVFDNLDRVSGENAVKIISVIKTFLEPVDVADTEHDVLFMIPCDVESIKAHLVKVFKDENTTTKQELYADEFLRKFFNTIVWIPEFHGSELEEFALRKLKETKVEEFNNDLLSWLIIRVFRDNPRQIIQFINILLANYLLLRQKSISGELGSDFHKKNIAQLAKFLLLVQRFPKEIEFMKQTRTYILTEFTKEGLSDLFFSFLEYTDQISIDSYEPFFKLKVSEQEKRLPGISRILLQLEQGLTGEAMNSLKDLKLLESKIEFNGIIRQTIEDANNAVTISYLINGVFLIEKEIPGILVGTTFQVIQNKFTPSVLMHLDKMDPKLVTEEFFCKYEVKKSKRIDVIKKWVDILGDYQGGGTSYKHLTDDGIINIFSQVCHWHRDIPSEHVARIQSIAQVQFGRSWVMFSAMTANQELVNKFITKEWYLSLLNSIPLAMQKEDIVNLSSLERLINAFLLNTIDTIFQKLASIVETENATILTEERANELEPFFELLTRLVETNRDKLELAGNPHVATFAQKSAQFFKNQRWVGSALIFPVLTRLSKISVTRGVVESHITNFVQTLHSISIARVRFIIKNDDHEFKILEAEIYKDYRLAAARDNPQFFSAFYSDVSDVEKQNWLLALLDAGLIERFQAKLEELGYNVPEKILLANRIITVLNSWTDQYRLILLDILENLQPVGADKHTLHSQFHTALVTSSQKSLLLDHFRRSNFLENLDKVGIIEKIISWQKTAPANLELIPFMIEFYGILDETKKNELKALIVDKVIMDSSPELITRGFMILMKVIEAKDTSLFENIKNKTEALAGNPQPQAALITGFSNWMKVLRGKEEIKEYEEWIKKFGE